MKYDYGRIIERRGTDCLKYDYAAENGRSAGAIPMWVADMDISAPPEVIEAIKKRAEHGVFGYTMPKRGYFEVVASWFARRHNWNADPQKFVCTPGVVFAINTLIRAVTCEGDGVIICQPVYYPFASGVKYNNRKLVVSELINIGGRYSIDFEDFERKIVQNGVKAFILCSPHNPVGRVWEEWELSRLSQICGRHGVFVIADEIHADFAFDGHRHIPYARVSGDDNFAVCTSPTKSFNLAGLQISNIYIQSSAVRKKFEDELDKTGYWEPNAIGLAACLAAYGQCGEWLDGLKNYLWENINFALSYISENIPKIKASAPEGTYLLWLDCRALGLSDGELSRFFDEKASVWPDDGFIFGQGGSGFERLNIACPRPVLKEALENLGRAVSSL